MRSDLLPLLWFDLETTGLDADDEVIEVAAVLTTPNLDPLGHYQRLVTAGPWQALIDRNPHVSRMHTSNGLLAELRDSPEHITVEQVDAELDEFITHHTTRGLVRLAGSGVTIFDRPIINRRFPLLAKRLAARNVDVADLRRSLRYLGVAPPPTLRAVPHRALGDIEAFIAEFAHYRTLLSHPKAA